MKKRFFTGIISAVLFMAGASLEVQACTSWMIFSDFTKNNTNILHKNRDSTIRIISVTLSKKSAARKWVALGSDRNGNGANMGINSSGLAGVMNSGERCIDHSTDKTKKGTPAILRVILESCDTAAQAVEKLKEIMKAGDYWHKKSGSIFFFCDKNEGYVCEMTAKDCSAQKYTRGYTVRANIWQNPNMYERSRNNLKTYMNSSARAFMAISGLNQIYDKYKKIPLEDIFALSRHYLMPEDSQQKRSLCFKYTNSTASLEIDRQYPGILSTLYVTIGHPRHTLYIPVPVCTEKLLPAMADFSWSKKVWERFDKLKLEAPIPAEWTKFEKDALAKYAASKEEARKLLMKGKKAEAAKVLNTTAMSIWKEAAALMKI